MKRNLWGVFLLALALSVLAGCLGPAAESWESWDEVPEDKRIDTPYVFSPAPGSDEWAALKTLDEKIEKTKIPRDTLIRMTAGALLNTVRSHPLLPAVLSVPPTQEGLDKVFEYMNCAEEFVSRADSEALLLGFVASANVDTDADPDGDTMYWLLLDRLLCAYAGGSLSAEPLSAGGRTHRDIPEDEWITAVYTFPAVPETDDRHSLSGLNKIVGATKIPDEVLVSMTTEALLETFLTHPLAVNLLAFDTPLAGVENLLSYLDCLAELISREDARELIYEKHEERLLDMRENAPERWKDYLLAQFVLRYFAVHSEGTKPSYPPVTLDDAFVAGLY